MITIKKRCFQTIIIAFVIGMLATIGVCIYKAKSALQGNYEKDNRVVTGLISNAIDNAFLRPITVAETISKDYTTKEILSVKSKEEAKEKENYAADYLKSLRDGFGYTMVYAVSNPAKTYFACNGISKYIDVDHDEHDLWYKNFLEAGQEYRLDVDTDESQNWSLSVFVNRAVYDDTKNFIGVCGVGVDMQELQSMLERYERIYDVKIDLINEDGLIQVDTDTSKIERDIIEIDNLTAYSDGECYYEILPKGSRTITYLKHLDWYLVIQNDNVWMEQVQAIIVPGLICIGLSLVIFGIALKYGLVRDNE